MEKRQKLIENLKAAGKETIEFNSPDGTVVLLLPYGGRVLGLYNSDASENFYWNNEVLWDVEETKKFYSSDQWHNSGGDRTWLAPEVDVFFPEFPSRDKYFQPRQLDPGSYSAETGDKCVSLTNQFKLLMSRTRQEIDVEIKKTVSPAANPFRYESDCDELKKVEYAGYTQKTSLQLRGKGANECGPVGLWNLVQMPHGGEMIIPTYFKTTPYVVMGKVPAEDLAITDNAVRYKMGAKGEYKISIRAVACIGRVGYLYRSGDSASLIVRSFSVNPSGEYVDVPWDNPDDKGFAIQACCVNAWYGSFSELEYHTPAIGKGTDRIKCEDYSQVWAFRGSYEEISRVGKKLLMVL